MQSDHTGQQEATPLAIYSTYVPSPSWRRVNLEIMKLRQANTSNIKGQLGHTLTIAGSSLQPSTNSSYVSLASFSLSTFLNIPSTR